VPTVLEEYTTEELRSVVHFSVGKDDSMQRIFVMKFFLFMVGSVCRIKRFRTGSINSFKDIDLSQMMPYQFTLLRLRQKQLCSGWKS
jgi:hypothetical protein